MSKEPTIREILEDNIIIHICSYCGGTGKMYKIGETINCDRCHGKGYEVEIDEAYSQILSLIKDKMPKKKELTYFTITETCKNCLDQNRCQECGYWNDYNQAIDDCMKALEL